MTGGYGGSRSERRTLGVVGRWFVFVGELFFQFADALDQLGELLGGDELALGLKIGDRGEAHVLLAALEIIQHRGLGSDHGFRSDCDVPEDSHLPPEHRVFADLGAAADTILGDDNAVFSNDDVVGDLHEVVDLGAFADEGVAECAAINSAVGADLDVVLDHDAADLRNFAVMILIKNITVAIGADDGAGVNADTVADPALRVNCDVGKQAHRLAKRPSGRRRCSWPRVPFAR